MTESVLTEEMKVGLAEIYANKGFREYLAHRILKATQAVNECLDKDDLKNAQRYAQRMAMMEELLSKGREQYTNFEKIKAKEYAKEQETSLQQEAGQAS